MEVADQLIDDGVVKRGYLGVRVAEVDNDLALALGMDKPFGALINDVEKGESADKGGLLPGDVITEFNGKEISLVLIFRMWLVELNLGLVREQKLLEVVKVKP